jgi:hypothetical protein
MSEGALEKGRPGPSLAGFRRRASGCAPIALDWLLSFVLRVISLKSRSENDQPPGRNRGAFSPIGVLLLLLTFRVSLLAVLASILGMLLSAG